ncbi:unnamed protein product [Mytilus coruscus]|uniref:Integrase catalytic domain-containing protein n=1 Tax=Mytilus coruscus TaxID=42192 RepID=A0A6J8DZ26_MYTCO|nr:unnamed protein product [Mytilus coruscus]
MWTQRDQFSNNQIPLTDQKLIIAQHEQRLKNHPHSEKAKCPAGKLPVCPDLEIDASESGYGTVTYLRFENAFCEIHCSFVMGKAHVTPLKTITVPRLELTAATVAVRTNKMLLNELEITVDRSIFWTDSMSVLRYILNEDAIFQTFEANRLAVIDEGSDTDNWRYDLKDAEHSILVFVQRHEFTDEISTLSTNQTVKATSNIRKLNPVLHYDLLRVGGRLIESKMPENCKHPIILPKGHHVSELILRQIHVDLQHSSRNHFVGRLREQKIAHLPPDRIAPDTPPFSRVGVDYFGPFEVKQRRCRIKRYGVIFTCLSSRAIHMEVAASLDTSSYINVLRRFIARRGRVEKIRPDKGTNFIGVELELKSALSE